MEHIVYPPVLTLRSIAPSYFTAAFHPSKSREYREHRPSSHSNNAVIRSIAWNNLGNRIACGLNTNLVRVWNPEKPEAKNSTELKGHLKDVEKVVWDPMHPDKLASCCNGQVKFWDYRINRCLGTTVIAGDNVNLAYHPDSKVLAVGTKDDRIHFIDPRNASAILKTHKEGSQSNQVTFSHNGEFVLITTSLGKVVLRHWPSLEEVYSVDAHHSAVNCLQLDPRGSTLAIGGSDAALSLWDTAHWVCLRTLTRMDAPIKSMGYSFDGAYVCASSDESTNIEIAHCDTGDYVHTIQTNHSIPNIAWHPNKYVLAYTGDPVGLKIMGINAV
ncbi:WD40-repeat-containing domain protein [Tuber brumale]|nr:WD40-repeat-containing domain protein [Tuber brumale]